MAYREPPSGIYCIEDLVTGDKYVGQSVDIFCRIANHRRLLGLGRHSNRNLQPAFSSHPLWFAFYVLELQPANLSWRDSWNWKNEKEAFYIKALGATFNIARAPSPICWSKYQCADDADDLDDYRSLPEFDESSPDKASGLFFNLPGKRRLTDHIDALLDALEKLPARHCRIIRATYGLDGGDAVSYREIGESEGVSGQRIQQICRAGLERLRQLLSRNWR